MSVGYICGPRISSYMFAGGLVSWMVLIPAVVLFGADLTLYPGTAPIGQMFAEGGASAIWAATSATSVQVLWLPAVSSAWQIPASDYPYIQ